MPSYILVLIVWVAILATVVFSVWKGGVAERWAGCLVGGGAVYGFLVARFLGDEWRTLAFLSGDFLLALGFLGLAVRYASLWLGGAMLLQAVQFMLHAWYMLGEREADLLHGVVNNADTMGILVCITFGTVTAWRRRNAARQAEAARGPDASPAPSL
ncbi:MAG TPA: hypothetical protein VEA44_06990, partial [Caulobacter sp.]|nr:hypothetical protein [Caulobacter sp.]